LFRITHDPDTQTIQQGGTAAFALCRNWILRWTIAMTIDAPGLASSREATKQLLLAG
jgi:hypothetical protein